MMSPIAPTPLSTAPTNPPSRLSRGLGTADAVFLGLGSMIGAGVFVAIGPAAAAAGSSLLLGLVIAGVIAFLNAMTMAQLAALYPESGGTYLYGRKRLGEVWGFLAGWGFIVGKIASCTAMALTFAHYAVPDYAKPVAIATVLALAFINSRGVRKTALLTQILVVIVLSTLGLIAFVSLFGGGADYSRLSNFSANASFPSVLESAGLLFFAFAGYARIATLGEEVRMPQKTIPRAIAIAFAITFLVYLAIFGIAVLCVDIPELASAQAPLVLAVESGVYAQFAPLVRVGAALASIGVLLSLMAGISRTVFAMAANRELPPWLSRVHPVHKTPQRAEMTVGFIVALILVFADLRLAIGFSSFAILVYYLIANVAASTLKPSERRWPSFVPWLGALGCGVVAIHLPWASVVGGCVLFAVGLLVFRRSPRGS